MSSRAPADPNAPAGRVPLYYPSDCEFIPLGSDTVMLYNRNDRRVHKLPQRQAELFSLLIGRRTCEHHLERLVSADANETPAGALRNLIQSWVSAGLLRAWKEREHANARAGADDGRQESGPAEGALRPQSVVQRHAAGYPGTVWYIDRAARRRLAARLYNVLNDGDLPAGILEYALLGETARDDPLPGIETVTTSYGAARNTLHLLTAGKRLCSSDDDIAEQFAVLHNPPGRECTLETAVSFNARFGFWKQAAPAWPQPRPAVTARGST